uniref:Uncharacterized protein n=1 Tax=Anguilla anguilla TaxID=7936 RepID=A0A0E9XSK8_ANGAN
MRWTSGCMERRLEGNIATRPVAFNFLYFLFFFFVYTQKSRNAA